MNGNYGGIANKILNGLFGFWEKGFRQISEAPYPNCPTDACPEIRVDPASGEHSMSLQILTYNVAGLPWPFLKNRDKPLAQIGSDLAELRAQGNAPDIVLIQEGFRSSTEQLIINSGYPYWAQGPMTQDSADQSGSFVTEAFMKARQWLKGEKFGQVMGSGLYILSEWPIASKQMEPFFSGACAGFDCGSNKGVMWTDIQVPGLPDALQVFNTHLNSRGASGVSVERALEAHCLQFRQMADFCLQHWNPAQPFIFGGDFNVREATGRIDHIRNYDFGIEPAPNQRGQLIFLHCPDSPQCEFRNNTIPADEPLNHQDWQGWSNGNAVQIDALLCENTFTGPDPRGYEVRGHKALSDHEGVQVHYKLRWMPEAEAAIA